MLLRWSPSNTPQSLAHDTWQILKRFFSISWLVAAPIIILVLFFAVPLIFGLVAVVVEFAFGPAWGQAVRSIANVVAVLEGILIGAVFWIANIVAAGYGISCRTTALKQAQSIGSMHLARCNADHARQGGGWREPGIPMAFLAQSTT